MAKQYQHSESLARIFRILGDQTRLRVLLELQYNGEMNVTQLCRRLKAHQPTISHHLGVLRMGDLVTARRNGKEVYYSLGNIRPAKLSRAIRSILKLIPS